jgi:hypothetical protein
MNTGGCQSAVRLLSFGMRVWRDRRFRLIFGPQTRGARFALKSVGTAQELCPITTSSEAVCGLSGWTTFASVRLR